MSAFLQFKEILSFETPHLAFWNIEHECIYCLSRLFLIKFQLTLSYFNEKETKSNSGASVWSLRAYPCGKHMLWCSYSFKESKTLSHATADEESHRDRESYASGIALTQPRGTSLSLGSQEPPWTCVAVSSLAPDAEQPRVCVAPSANRVS